MAGNVMRLDVDRHRKRLAAVEAAIARLEASMPKPDLVAEHAHLGRIGSGSGKGSARVLRRINARRQQALERTIDIAVKLTRLYAERDHLRAVVAAEEARPAREAAEAERVAASMRAIRAAGPGAEVVDDAFGVVRVVRINRRTVTIETPSGYREAREFRRILAVKSGPMGS